jgi:hypothetical protein
MEQTMNTAEQDRFAKYRSGIRADLRAIKAELEDLRADVRKALAVEATDRKDERECGDSN